MVLPRSLISIAFVSVSAACASGEAPRQSMPAADAQQSIPPDFVVSTTEPSWRARVQGQTVLLEGRGQERRFTLEINESLFDGRAVTARDDKGTLELRVTERLCVDSMSGKAFAYTGRLTLDEGEPVLGCGEPL